MFFDSKNFKIELLEFFNILIKPHNSWKLLLSWILGNKILLQDLLDDNEYNIIYKTRTIIDIMLIPFKIISVLLAIIPIIIIMLIASLYIFLDNMIIE